MTENPDIRWFDAFPSCQRCRKPSNGILRGVGNASFGYHCRRCADKRLKDRDREHNNNLKAKSDKLNGNE